jgi:hypothetical protein
MLDVRPVDIFDGAPKLILSNDKHGPWVRDIRRGEGVQSWQLDIAPTDQKNLALIWTTPSIRAGKVLVLRDVVADRLIDMTAYENYDIPCPTQLPQGRFKIYLGTAEEVKDAADEPTNTRPSRYRLYQNFPNPFNPSTSISFDLPSSGNVKLGIFNILGRRVITLIDEHLDTGSHLVQWNGRDSNGEAVAAGMYFARLAAGDYSASIKLILVK